MSEPQANEFSGWAIVELMGHVRFAGLCTQSSVAGLTAMRLDVFAGEAGEPVLTKYFPNGSAFYAVTPATEETCRRIGAQHAGLQPAAAFALPAPDRANDDADLFDEDTEY